MLTGIVSYTTLNVADPVAVGVDAMGKGMFWLRPIVKVAAIAGLSSVILVMLLGQPRIFYSMSKDGLLPPVFSKVHPKFKTPYISTIITGTVAMIIAGILANKYTWRTGINRHSSCFYNCLSECSCSEKIKT